MDSTRVTVTIHPRTDFEGWGDAAVNYPEEFFPAIAQLVNSVRNVRIISLYAQNDENLLAGYFEAGQFRWTITADRMGQGFVYRFDTNTDISWIAPSLSFNPALYAGMAQIHGTRTAVVPVLAVQLQWALYDLSWLHDVIPLTDPEPGADTVYLRPIAPIMSARRRKKRRR